MAQTQIERAVGNKLWTNEERMIDECFIYLNKSTTKYIIVGVDATTYASTIRLCDRSTGSHLSLTLKQFNHFVRIIKAVIDGSYSYIADFGHAEDMQEFSHIVARSIGSHMWKITSSAKPGCIVTHTDTLRNFMNVEHVILRELLERNGTEYRQLMGHIKQSIPSGAEWTYLHSELATSVYGSKSYKVLFAIMCHYASLKGHQDVKVLFDGVSYTSTAEEDRAPLCIPTIDCA